MKIVCIANGPLPYHTPILNSLNTMVDLEVIYMYLGHPLRSFKDQWGECPQFRYKAYRSLAMGFYKNDFRIQISFGISIYLLRLNPDIIFFSSWGPLTFEPILWKSFFKKKAVMWAESTKFSGLLRGTVSDGLRRLLLARLDGFISNGSCATEYLLDIGVSPLKIVESCLPASNIFREISCKTENHATGRAAGPRFLFVGRLIPRKRPLIAVEAFSRVLSAIPNARLSIVGSGPLEGELHLLAKKYSKNVEMLGRIEGQKLKRLYAVSDILLVPSVREVWGLVVNEALSQGMYVIASNQVGSAHDLIVNNKYGKIVQADNVEELAAAMLTSCHDTLLDDFARKKRMLSVAKYDSKAFANDIFKAAILATEGRA